ncbi:MAG: hypothetical protein AAFU66_03720 [Pseudomonadota bacterium]
MNNTQPAFDAITKTGTFTGRDGNQKNSYRTIGAAWTGDDGGVSAIRIDFLPVHFDGAIYLRSRDAAERKDNDAERGGTQ